MDPPALREIFLGSEVCLPESATATQLCRGFHQYAHCVCRAQTPVDCSELHQQPVDAVLRPTFIRNLCYKLPSVVTFTLIQIFLIKILSYLLNGIFVTSSDGK